MDEMLQPADLLQNNPVGVHVRGWGRSGHGRGRLWSWVLRTKSPRAPTSLPLRCLRGYIMKKKEKERTATQASGVSRWVKGGSIYRDGKDREGQGWGAGWKSGALFWPCSAGFQSESKGRGLRAFWNKALSLSSDIIFLLRILPARCWL